MTKEYFNAIDGFVKIRDKCPFCQHDITVRLRNFVSGPGNGKLSTINSRLVSDHFVFDFQYVSYSTTIKSKGTINALTNYVSFDLDYDVCTEFDADKVIESFDSICPHVELSCENKACKMEYYLASSIFRFEKLSGFTALVKPMSLEFESCNVGKLWIQNDPSRQITKIYTRGNEQPMQTQYLDFDLFGKDKLINRIKTLVVFS